MTVWDDATVRERVWTTSVEPDGSQVRAGVVP